MNDRREPLVRLKGITKRFPRGVTANRTVDLTLYGREIHALVGENGAGKTTLMNVLFGLAQPDEGQIVVGGRPVRHGTPADAIANGIGMVHQHFKLVPRLTVAENLILGRFRETGLRFAPRRVAAEINELSRPTASMSNPAPSSARCPWRRNNGLKSSKPSTRTHGY